ncbi:TatD family hydrolase [Hugenholtzia roseola]|uniref:TatD family hydrolase n=1 Tax=Hugenholtzia roseola TaxID=1002 RepID=UPI000401ECD4|nr:TatD family hydrolase [Hugenholtzia roseola]
MSFIDTHAHIYDKSFDKDRAETLNRARQAGVSHLYLPNVDSTSIDAMMEVELQNPDYCTALMGLHPCSVKKDFEKELYIVEDWLHKREFVAVGEIGLDFYWDTTFMEQQKEAFKIQIEWAKMRQIPIVIHTRNSTNEALDLIESVNDDNLRGIFHCFGGTEEQAERIKAAGFLMGIGGVVTFKNSGLADFLHKVGLEHLVLETDAPYLAPVPYRGKRNEPAYLEFIAKKIAEICNCSPEKVAKQTSLNANALFEKKKFLNEKV